ncbi:hypothetical protein F4819DRAFT_483309 [Hypoxylon fuscum]|nr:hypothetical protein F4819DRAFT_483309 [Hypoxylon fuscum]
MLSSGATLRPNYLHYAQVFLLIAGVLFPSKISINVGLVLQATKHCADPPLFSGAEDPMAVREKELDLRPKAHPRLHQDWLDKIAAPSAPSAPAPTHPRNPAPVFPFNEPMPKLVNPRWSVL